MSFPWCTSMRKGFLLLGLALSFLESLMKTNIFYSAKSQNSVTLNV